MRNWDLATQAERDEELLKCMLDPVYFINNYAVAFNVVTQRFDNIQCFPYQENVIDQYLTHAFNIILKSRQCLPEDTFVDTPTGPRKIQDLQVGDAVFSYDLKNGRMEVDKVYDAWCSGDRQCVKFKLQDTRNFEVGENHPFYVKGKGFVKAKDIVRGDEILNDNIGFGDQVPSDSEIKLLAYLITDGTTKKQVKFTNNNLEYLAEFEESVNDMFPSLHVSRIPKLNGYDYMPAQKHGVNTVNPVMEWCKTKNIAGKLSAEKSLPEEVFQWSKRSVALLLNRMFAGDGWISIMKKNAAKRIELGIASPNLEFMHQVKSLLNKFGISSNIYEVKNMKLQKNRFFKLRVTHSKSVARFIHQIGIYGKVRQEHLDIIRNGKHNVKAGAIVKKIETTRVLKCYDISVEKNENFFVDGLLTHNTGISVITAAYVAWRILFKSDERVLIMANNAVGAKRFLSHVKSFITNTPRFLKPKGGDENGSVKWNDTRIDMANSSWAMALAASAQAGRGESLSLVVLDEFAFVEKDKSIWTAISPALSMSRGDCIMISTPFGSGNVFHEYWVAAEQKKSLFNSIRVHWSENPFCARGLRHIEENGKLILWSPWYEEQRQQFNYDSVKIAQELDLSFLGSKLLAVDELIVNKYREKIDKEKIEPICYFNYKMRAFTEKENEFWVWKKPEPSGSYVVSCLPVGEMILTDSGLKKIEDVGIGDMLVDIDGKLTEIKNIQITKDYQGDVIEILPSNSFRSTTFTGNHPIWASTSCELKRNYNKTHDVYRFNERFWDLKMDFKPASEVNEGDWLEIPNRFNVKGWSDEEMSKKWIENSGDVRYDHSIKCPLLDADFWWFVGMWLAEGWATKNGYAYNIETAHSIKEKHYAQKIKHVISKYDRSVTIQECDYNTIKTLFTSREVHSFLRSVFGSGAQKKRIPDWVKMIKPEFKVQLIRGYLEGDGCWIRANRKDRKNNNSKMSFTSISLELLEGIQDMLFSLGIISCLNLLRDEGVAMFSKKGIHSIHKTKKTFSLNLANHDSIKLANLIGYEHDFSEQNNRIISNCFFSKDMSKIYMRVKKVTKKRYSGTVMNFETKSHTFMCRNIVTHNCDVARGDGNDYSTIQIIDVNTLEQVAEYQGKIDPDMFADVIYAAGLVYNEAYVVVECNSMGLATTYKLERRLKYSSKRMFHSKSFKQIHVRPTDYEDFVVEQGKSIPGFQTTFQSKVMVVDAIRTAMREEVVKINSKRLMNEFNTWVMETKQERVIANAEPGYNDDLIMAFGIGLYIRQTEYSNLAISNNMTRAMLDAFTVSTSPMYGKNLTKDELKAEEKARREAFEKNTGLFFFRDGNAMDQDDPNDTSWLIG